MVPFIGSVVELVDTPDLGSGAERRASSSLATPTNKRGMCFARVMELVDIAG